MLCGIELMFFLFVTRIHIVKDNHEKHAILVTKIV